MDLLVNYIYNDEIVLSKEHKIYLKSMEKIPNCTKILIYDDVSKNKLDKLKSIYDRVISIPKSQRYNLKTDFDLILNDLILTDYFDHEYTLYIDCLDIIMQSNPFDYMKKYKESMFLCTPGHLGKDSMADCGWISSFNKTTVYDLDFFNFPVINGGLYGGKTRDFLDCLIFMISNQNRNNRFLCDQTILAYYAKLMDKRTSLKIFNTHEDTWAYHTQMFEETPNIINGKICNKNNEPYCIWHMWDDFAYGKNFQKKLDLDFESL